MQRKPQTLIPITVVTGFLGSGKTTLLRHLINQPELNRTLVIVNEFGKIGLDHHLVSPGRDAEVVEMSSGCLCCTFLGDLAKTLREAPSRYSRGGEIWFDRVVIETTGLADPAPILHTLMEDESVLRKFRLDGVITTIDSINGNATLDQHVESLKQAAVADRLLLTKADLADERELSDLQARLARLNPGAEQRVVAHGEVDAAWVFDVGVYEASTKSVDVQKWLQDEAHFATAIADAEDSQPVSAPMSRHDAGIKSHSLAFDTPVDRSKLEAWLSEFMQRHGKNLLRLKGLINIPGLEGPMVIHGAHHTLHPPVFLDAWPSDDRRSRLVLITRHVDAEVIKQSFGQITRGETECSETSLGVVAVADATG